MALMFWSSADLTGNQTRRVLDPARFRFWSSADLTGNQTHEKGHPCGCPGSTFWSGRRDSNPHGRCPRAPEARASAVPPRPDGTWPRNRTPVSGFGDRCTAIVLARCV